MLLGILSASLLRKLITGQGTIRAGGRRIRENQSFSMCVVF